MSAKLRPAHLILLLIGVVCLAALPAVAEYRESRELTLDAADLDRLDIEAGPGSLDVRGVDGLKRIEAKVEIVVERISESRGADYVAHSVVFNLQKQGSGARLVADHRSGLSRRDWQTRVNLTVRMPAEMALSADDDSGDLEIQHLAAGLDLRDDSGNATVRDIAGGVTIDDDSGELIIEDIHGDVSISDDSGDIVVNHVQGALEIDDDSGDITVEFITGDVRIYDDSGDIEVSTVQGNVTIDDDSGDISVDNVTGNLDIPDPGSGGLHVNNIHGTTRIDS